MQIFFLNTQLFPYKVRHSVTMDRVAFSTSTKETFPTNMDLEVGKEKGNHDLTTTVALVEMKETVLAYATLHTTAKMEY